MEVLKAHRREEHVPADAIITFRTPNCRTRSPLAAPPLLDLLAQVADFRDSRTLGADGGVTDTGSGADITGLLATGNAGGGMGPPRIASRLVCGSSSGSRGKNPE